MLCGSCYAEIPAGSASCPRCSVSQATVGGSCASPAPVAVDAVPSQPAPDNPWENREGRSALEAFGETLQRSLFHPARFFRGTSPGGSVWPALGYAAGVGTVSLVVMGLWQAALASVVRGGEGVFAGAARGWPGAVLLLPLVPASLVAWSLAAAAVLHVSLLLLRGGGGGYAATLKAVCYASSGMAFYAVPGIGLPLGAVWQGAVSVIGLREMHRSCCTARAVLAYLLPLFVGLGLVIVAALIAALAGIGAFMHLLQRGVPV